MGDIVLIQNTRSPHLTHEVGPRPHLTHEGYRELIPEDPGFRKRRALYELYHKLNHFNLFGGGYKSESLSLMNQLARG